MLRQTFFNAEQPEHLAKRPRTLSEQKHQEAYYERRRRKRASLADTERSKPRPRLVRKYASDVKTLPAPIRAEALPTARGAYAARRSSTADGWRGCHRTLKELIEVDGFAYKAWDGR